MKVVREEIFGPVVCASPITDADLDGIAARSSQDFACCYGAMPLSRRPGT